MIGDEPIPDHYTGRERWYAVAALLLLATTLAEALTGSTPVPKLVNPLTFLFVAGNYGLCALLIREASVRWNKRWASVLLLGAAFGVESEGLGAKTLIDSTGSVLGTTQVYSYWMGVNWVPFVYLTVFHAVFSIASPILLVELLFPRTRGKRLMGDAGLAFALVVFALDSVFLIAVAGPHYFPPLPLLFICGVGTAYVVAAYLVPRDLMVSTAQRPNRSEGFFFGIGAGFFAGLFFLTNFGPRIPAAGTICLFAGLAALWLYLLLRHAGIAHNEVSKVDVLLGLTSVFVPMDILLEIGGDVGVLVVTGFTIGLLLLLRRKWLPDEGRDSDPLSNIRRGHWTRPDEIRVHGRARGASHRMNFEPTRFAGWSTCSLGSGTPESLVLGPFSNRRVLKGPPSKRYASSLKSIFSNRSADGGTVSRPHKEGWEPVLPPSPSWVIYRPAVGTSPPGPPPVSGVGISPHRCSSVVATLRGPESERSFNAVRRKADV